MAFQNNKITSVTIPASVTSMGNQVFGDNPLTSVTIEANLAYSGAFNEQSVGSKGRGKYTRPNVNSQWTHQYLTAEEEAAANADLNRRLQVIAEEQAGN